MESKKAVDSQAISCHIVLPNDTNVLNNLMGGKLLHWMDVIAAISAKRHCGRVVVTASVNNVSFNQPIRLGDTVTLKAQVSRAFNTSMEVFIDVSIEDHRTGEHIKCNEAIYTFVAVDQVGSPIEVPGIIPESDLEKVRFENALRRKELSLILGGKMKPEEAKELKAIFG